MFVASGFKTISHIGSVAGLAGSNIALHAYVTNDDGPAVETAGYFNTLATRLKVGDQILATLDLDGVIGLRNYFVATNAGGVVTIGRESIGTGAGLTTVAFFFNLADITAVGDLLTNYVLGYAGRIEAVDWAQQKPVTTAAKAASINVEIGAVNLTGGVVALTSANTTPMGAGVAGSAVTGNNVFTATDAISLEVAGLTAFAEGSGWLLLRIRNLEG